MLILESVLVVAQQVLMLFLLIGVGWVGKKVGLLNDAGADQLSRISMNIITPCVIIHSLQREKDPALFAELGIGIAACAGIILAATFLSRFFFRRSPEEDRRVLRFAMSYPNSGYMGIPLVQATLGDDAVVYAAAAVIGFNLTLWTSGVILSGGKKEMSLRKVFVNPGIIGFSIAFLLFCFEITLPTPLGGAVKMFADMNTPVAMLAIGIFVANTNLKECFAQTKLYAVCALRLIAFPALLVLALYPLGLHYEMYASAIITACAPTAAVTAIFAARYKLNTGLGAQAVTLCTLLSILTMPLFVGVVRAITL